MRKPYPSDLTDEQWAVIEPLIPIPKVGRPREVDMREVLNAILYLNRSGCQWDMLPDDLPAAARDYVEFLEADNWLSVPCVVDERYFLKVITPAHSLVHGLLTTGRNLGAFSSGVPGFFERFDAPVEMAEHELAATRRMYEEGLNVPEPVEAFEHDQPVGVDIVADHPLAWYPSA